MPLKRSLLLADLNFLTSQKRIDVHLAYTFLSGNNGIFGNK